MCVVCWSLFVVCCWLLAVRCVLSVVAGSSFGGLLLLCCSSRCLQLAAVRNDMLLFRVRCCLVFVAFCLFVVRCVLCVVVWVYVDCCVLFV